MCVWGGGGVVFRCFVGFVIERTFSQFLSMDEIFTFCFSLHNSLFQEGKKIHFVVFEAT